MTPEEIVAAGLVYDDMIESKTNMSFGYFKRETEALIGRTLFASEAQELWAYVSKPA